MRLIIKDWPQISILATKMTLYAANGYCFQSAINGAKAANAGHEIRISKSTLGSSSALRRGNAVALVCGLYTAINSREGFVINLDLVCCRHLKFEIDHSLRIARVAAPCGRTV
jgi:hypothetical protein